MRKLIVPSVLAVALALTSSAASAATWGGEVFGAFNTHAMENVNDQIDLANQGGADINNVENGWGGGLGLRMWATPNWMFSAGWEPLWLNAEDEVSGDKTSLNANAFTVTGSYFFPTAGNAKYGIGAGIGYYSMNGDAESTGSPTVDVTGSTVGFHFMGLAEWTVSPGFAITGGAGYRIANVADTQFDDQSASPEFETDYSGFMARAGLAFYMPTK